MTTPSRQDAAPDDAAAALELRRRELEIRIAELDDAVDALHRTVYRQQQQLDRLAQALAALRQHQQAAPPDGDIDPLGDVPPHY